jgi:transposase-like protein
MRKRIKKPRTRHEPASVSLSDLIYQHVRAAIETAVLEELRTAVGATPYERNGSRCGHRNGAKRRTLTGPTGPFPLTVPRHAVRRGAGMDVETCSALSAAHARGQ